METGVGNPEDVNPQVMVSISTDGVIFGNEYSVEIGREGNRQRDIDIYSNKYLTDLVVRIRYSANTRFSLYSSCVWLKEVGK